MHVAEQDRYTEEREFVRRVPLLASLLGAALPGLGQLYNGQANRSIWFFLVFTILTVPVVMVAAAYLPAALTVGVLAISVLLSVGVWLWGIIDAWRVARRSNPYRLKPWQTSGMYAAVFVLCGLIIMPLVVFSARHYVVEPFRIPSSSMVPTLQPGDFIFATKRYNCPTLCLEQAKHGDIALFVYPNNRTQYYIKRIIGLPGDLVVAREGIISVNGTALSDTNSNSGEVSESIDGRMWTVRYTEDMEDFSETVKAGHVFVL